MKRSVLFLGMLLGGFLASAQMASENVTFHVPNHDGSRPAASSSRNTTEMLIWYGSAEEALYGTGGYNEFIWDMNSNFGPLDSNIAYVSLAYPVLINELGDNSTEVDWANVVSVDIDSIFVQVGHENNSGLDDTLRVSIVSLVNGRPTGSVLWSEDLISNTSFTGDTNWLSTTFLGFEPAIQVTSEFGVRIEYFGSFQDTFGIVAGYAFAGQCGTNTFDQAIETLYATNSFRYYTQYASFGLLPNASGADIYYDCNGSGQYEEGQDGENFLQNINVAVDVTITDNVSLEELPSAVTELSQNYPNPFDGTTALDYTLNSSADVTFEVVDLAGRVVVAENMGTQFAGNYTFEIDGSTLSSGVYYVNMTVNGERVTRKMLRK